MAEDLGRLDVTLEDFLNVGAADAAGGNFDEYFAGADFGDGTCSTRTIPFSR
jgi:hypothetical protein